MTPVSADHYVDEAGFTLVEVLVTVWILGTVMVAMAGALFGMVRASDLSRGQALAETELRHYTEAVRAAVYKPCAVPADYSTAAIGYAPPTGVTLDATAVHFWTKSTDTAASPTIFTSGPNDVSQHSKCAGTPPADDGVQRIDLSVRVTGTGDVRLATTIDKRDNRTAS